MTVQNASSVRPSQASKRAYDARVDTPVGTDVDELAPQSLSGVFDQAFDLYKRHFKTLALIAALLYFPAQIVLHGIFNTWMLPLVAHLQTPSGSGDFDAWILAFCGSLLIGIPEYGLPGLSALVVLAVMSGPMCVAVSDVYFGRIPTIKESYRRSIRAMPRLAMGWMLAGLICFGVGVVCTFGLFFVVIIISALLTLGGLGAGAGANITLVLMLIGLIVSYLLCMAIAARFFLFVTPLAVLEGLPLMAVWNRNQQMVARLRFRHSWAAAAALPLIVLGLQYLILWSVYNTLSALQLSPLIAFLVTAAFTALIVLFFQPYAVVFLTMLYYDYRVRGEGLDLVLLSAARLNAESAGEAQTQTTDRPQESRNAPQEIAAK